jgi:hypothetical protein
VTAAPTHAVSTDCEIAHRNRASTTQWTTHTMERLPPSKTNGNSICTTLLSDRHYVFAHVMTQMSAKPGAQETRQSGRKQR